MANFTLTIKQLVENKVDIFDFDYPITPSYKKEFEEKFINHFYFREIGCEAVGRFKHYLKSELNMIMPYFNKLYMSQGLEQRILDNYDITETFKRVTKEDSTGDSTGENKNLFTDTPKKKIDIDSVDYVSTISKDLNKNNSKVINNGNEEWERKMTGNIGIQYDGQAISAFEKSLRIIDEEVFTRLDNLFMGVY